MGDSRIDYPEKSEILNYPPSNRTKSSPQDHITNHISQTLWQTFFDRCRPPHAYNLKIKKKQLIDTSTPSAKKFSDSTALCAIQIEIDGCGTSMNGIGRLMKVRPC